MYVEECSMMSVQQTFEGIDMMIKAEIKSLEESVLALTVDPKTSKAIHRKVKTVENLQKTIGGLMNNIIHEVKKSRVDILRIVEQLEGFQEAASLPSGGIPSDDAYSTMTTNATSALGGDLEFEDTSREENKQGEDSGSNNDTMSEYSGSGATDSEFVEYNEDEENEIFLDAHEQIIKIDEEKASETSNKFGIIDIP